MKIETTMPRRRARVEIIPLIDCVFILLVFFIYSMLAMTMERGIAVELPSAQTAESTPETAVVISIGAMGTVYIDETEVSFDSLGPALDNALSNLASPEVIVNADAASQHRWFVQVMDELKRRGIARVVVRSEETVSP